MGSLVHTSCDRYPHIEPEQLARFFAYTLAINHITRPEQEQFDRRFKIEIPFRLSDLTTNQASDDYVVNNTNLPVAIALDSHLGLRQARCQKTGTQALDIGLGGLVIEGEPGEGKSALIFNRLIAHGY